MITIQETFIIALAHQQAERVAEAEFLYREILKLSPDNPSVINNLGYILPRDEAIELLTRVLLLNPDNADLKAALNVRTFESALEHHQGGRLLEAERLYREILERAPDHASALSNLAFIAPDEEAIAIYRGILEKDPDNVAALNNLSSLMPEDESGRLQAVAEGFDPNNKAVVRDLANLYITYALLFEDAGEIDRSMSAFRRAGRLSSFVAVKYHPRFTSCWLYKTMCKQGFPTARPPASGRPSIAISSLAFNGRFAHTVHNYLAGRLYAEYHGLELQTPEWVGSCFFELNDPLIDGEKAFITDDQVIRSQIDNDFPWDPGHPLVDVDIFSPVFSMHDPRHFPKYRAWLRPREVWRPYMDPVMERLHQLGNTVVAIHIRLGDIRWPIHFDRYRPPPLMIYQRWLDELLPSLDRPVVYIASDEADFVKQELRTVSPVSLDDLVSPWTGFEFLQDFHVLTEADVIGISVGGFGRLAAILNHRATGFFRPDADRMVMEPFTLEMDLFDP